MKIRMLGTHISESRDARTACVVIDDVLAIDAGSITSTLTYREQLDLKTVLITHHHYDHIKDLIMLGATFYNKKRTIPVYSILPVYEAIRYIFQYPGKFYTDFLSRPEENPTFKFTVVEPLKPFVVEGYEIIAVPVNHSVPAVGFQVGVPGGKKLFYTGDTGTGLEECWRHIKPDLLIIETTASNRFLEEATKVKHLTPALLREELLSFRKIQGYLPQVITTHHFPDEIEEAERKEELGRVSKELNIPITTGYEGMEIDL